MATYYWVGGTGTWTASSTTNWASSSGGGGGAGFPTSADDVIFNGSSGTGTVSFSGSCVCRNLTVDSACTLTIQGGTISGGLFGNLTLGAGGTYTFVVNIPFSGSATGRTVTTNNKSVGNSTWTFSHTGDITISGNVSGTVNHNVGTLNLGSGTYTGPFAAGNGTGPATLNMNSAYLSLSGANPWTCNPTNYTINGGTSTIDMYQNAGTFAGGGKSYYIVKLSNTQSGTIVISGANTFNTLNIYGPTDGGTGKLVSFAANQTITNLVTTSSSAENRVQYQSSVAGTQRTLTVASITTPNTNYKDIVIAGAASPYSASFGISDLGNNSGITFNTQTAYWIGGTGNWTDGTKWSLTSGGSAANALPGGQNSVIFDANSNTGTTAFTVTVNAASYCNDFSTGGGGGALDAVMTLAGGGSLNIYGSLTTPATNFTRTYTGTLTFASRSTGKTITSNGVSWGFANIIFNGVGGGWTLQDAYTCNSIDLINGSLDTNNQTLTTGRLTSNNANIRSLTLGSSTVDCNYAGINFTNSTNFTFNAGTSQIYTNSSSGVIEGIFASGLTFYNVSMTDTVSYSVTISGSNTFNNLNFVSKLGTSEFTLGGNQIVNGTFSTSNNTNPTYRSRIKSTVQGTQRTIKFASSSISNADFKDIAIDATSGTYPLTGTSLGNAGNNSGITFTAPKTVYWNLAGTQDWNATAWSTTNNGTPSVNNYPIPQDTAVFTEAGAAGTIYFINRLILPNITFADGVSNRTSSVTVRFNQSGAAYYFNGNFTGCSSLSITDIGGNSVYFQASGTQTFTSNGSTISLQATTTLYSTFGCNFTLGDSFTLGCYLIVQAGGTLTLNGKTLTLIRISLIGVATIDFDSLGVINLTGNANTIWTGSSTQVITGTSVVNCTYSGATGTRTINAGTPTEANTVNFNITAGTDSVNVATNIRSLDLTGFAGTLVNSARTLYGNWTNPASGITWNGGTLITTFARTSGTQTITTNGVTLQFPITINGVGGTTQLADDLTLATTRALTLTNGTFDANNKNVTIGSFVSTNTTVRTLNMGSGTWSLANTGFVWNCATSTNLTVNPSTSTIVATNTTVSARTFAGGGLTYNNLVIGGTTGTSTFNFTGSNTFNTISSTKTVAHTILFTASTTTTVTNFTVSGTSGNVVTIGSVSAASHTLAKAGGGTITVDYSSISRSTATPTLTWLATNSTDGGNNSGWSFGSFPTVTTNGNYFLLF